MRVMLGLSCALAGAGFAFRRLRLFAFMLLLVWFLMLWSWLRLREVRERLAGITDCSSMPGTDSVTKIFTMSTVVSKIKVATTMAHTGPWQHVQLGVGVELQQLRFGVLGKLASAVAMVCFASRGDNISSLGDGAIHRSVERE